MPQPKGTLIYDDRYNKKEFKERWAQITNSVTATIDPQDLKFIIEALKLVPRYRRIALDDKTRYIITERKFQRYTVKGLVLYSPNSNTEIWVGKESISNLIYPPKERKQKSVTSILMRGLRQLVEPDMSRERQLQRRLAFSEGTAKCPLSHVLLTKCDRTELDHHYPFSLLVNDFLWHKKLAPENVKFVKRGTNVIFADKQFAEDWIKYHRTHAKLQLTCKKANREKSNKW